MAPDWTLGSPRGWMSTSDYRDACSSPPPRNPVSDEEDEVSRNAEQDHEQMFQTMMQLPDESGTRVPIRTAVARYRDTHRICNSDYWIQKRITSNSVLKHRICNSDYWIQKRITSNSVLKRVLALRKEGGRWTVNGTVLDRMEKWMWSYTPVTHPHL